MATEEFLTQEEAADDMGMSVSFVKKARKHLGLKFYKLGKSVRIKRSDLEKWKKLRLAS